MLFLVLFVLLCTALMGWAILPLVRRREATAPATAGESGAASPESLEGVLVAQMMDGEITVGQYRRAVERLAARDDLRHPLTVPPELGPAGS